MKLFTIDSIKQIFAIPNFS